MKKLALCRKPGTRTPELGTPEECDRESESLGWMGTELC
jgi:hypothetical protein